MDAQKIIPAHTTVQNVVLLCLHLQKLYETCFVNQKILSVSKLVLFT